LKHFKSDLLKASKIYIRAVFNTTRNKQFFTTTILHTTDSVTLGPYGREQWPQMTVSISLGAGQKQFRPPMTNLKTSHWFPIRSRPIANPLTAGRNYLEGKTKDTRLHTRRDRVRRC